MKTRHFILTLLMAAYCAFSMSAQQGGNPYADQDKPVYLIDCIKENGETIVSWKYNVQHLVSAIELYNQDGMLIQKISYPNEFYNASSLKGVKTVTLKSLNDKNEVTMTTTLTLADDSKKLYLKGKPGRIKVVKSSKGAYFVAGDGKEPFIVKGINYIELRGVDNGNNRRDHSTFDAKTPSTGPDYNPYHAETTFRIMKRNGFNTVRVFVIGRTPHNPGIAGWKEYDKPIYEPYMDNFIDFVMRAQKYGIYVFPTLGDGEFPLNDWYQKQYSKAAKGRVRADVPFFKETVDLKEKYILAILDYIQEKKPVAFNSIFSLQLQNEYALESEQWPFTVREGKLDMFWGKSYDMADLDSRQQLADDATINYHNAMYDAIKKKYPDLLVSEGFFTLDIVGKTPENSKGVIPGSFRDHRYPPTFPVFARTKLDFLDMHIYPDGGKKANLVSMADQVERNLKAMHFYKPEFQEALKEKPVILGEFGAWTNMGKTAKELAPEMTIIKNSMMSKGFQGYLYWTFDTFEQPFLHNFMSSNQEIMDALK